ncbi:MAG: hypothetical protein CFE43_21760 [Burkholderiales bacterium PBB3]|nr:MAG: hypothetical protein CFE43_21760 [Burkholderiales bacterium PBB3]
MSDSIPVTIHVLRLDRFANRFGDEIARLLNSEPKSARVHAYESRWGSINSDERRLKSYSRGGMVVFALGKLIERSGVRSLAFLGDLTHTHELIAQENYPISGS